MNKFCDSDKNDNDISVKIKGLENLLVWAHTQTYNFPNTIHTFKNILQTILLLINCKSSIPSQSLFKLVQKFPI